MYYICGHTMEHVAERASWPTAENAELYKKNGYGKYIHILFCVRRKERIT